MTSDIFSSDVPRLNRSDFSPCGSLKTHKNGVSAVLFYLSSNRFCQTFAPEFKKLVGMCSGICETFAVNMEQGTNNALLSMSSKFPYDISNYPTIVIYFDGEPCSVYLGVRSADSLLNSLKSITTRNQCKFEYKPCE